MHQYCTVLCCTVPAGTQYHTEERTIIKQNVFEGQQKAKAKNNRASPITLATDERCSGSRSGFVERCTAKHSFRHFVIIATLQTESSVNEHFIKSTTSIIVNNENLHDNKTSNVTQRSVLIKDNTKTLLRDTRESVNVNIKFGIFDVTSAERVGSFD